MLEDNLSPLSHFDINTYSMKQPDLYYLKPITPEMTSQAESNFVWRMQAAGEYSL